jgi:hydrogenase expression/formation protein HypD
MLAAIESAAQRDASTIDGMMVPGHVAAIFGMAPFRKIARNNGLPIVIAGFEVLDTLLGILLLVRQARLRQARAENQYSRVVSREGNAGARQWLTEVYERSAEKWSGLGTVPGGRFHLRPQYRELDAMRLLE